MTNVAIAPANVSALLAARKKAAAAKAPAKDTSSSPEVTLPEVEGAPVTNHAKLARLVQIGQIAKDLETEKDALKTDLLPLAEWLRQDQARTLKQHVSTLRINGIAKYTCANSYGTPGMGLSDSLEAPLEAALGAQFPEYFTITTKTTFDESKLETALAAVVAALQTPSAEGAEALPDTVRVYDALEASGLLVIRRYVKPTEKFHQNLSDPTIAALCAEYPVIHPMRYFGDPPKSKR